MTIDIPDFTLTRCIPLTGMYYVILDTIDDSVRQHRDLAQRLYMAPSVSFVQTNLTSDLYSKSYKTTVRISVSTSALLIHSFLSRSDFVSCDVFYRKAIHIYLRLAF